MRKFIATLRKEQNMTQMELASKLGVTDRAVSKWESAQCCPDIQLLPDLANVFDVSIDELIGYKSTEGLGDICLKIKEHFSALPEKKSAEKALHDYAASLKLLTEKGENNSCWQEKKQVLKNSRRPRAWG